MASPTTRSPSSGATRERILAAAERLFAQHGFDGTTMRALTRAAEANLAAVNYHFGSKDGLLEEVFRTYLEPINRERLRLLDEAEAAQPGQALPIRRLLHLFLAPAVRALAGRHTGIPSILSRLHHEPNPVVERLILEVSRPVVQRYGAAVQIALPHLDAQRVLLRGHFMIGAMLYVLGHGRVLMEGMLPEGAQSPGAEDLLEALLDFCEAGFCAHA